MSKWIFQDIQDIQQSVLYRKPQAEGKELDKRIEEYYAALREKVEPETFVRYELYLCDIYVDVDYIAVEAYAIYGDKAKRSLVIGWLEKHRSDHHVLEYEG